MKNNAVIKKYSELAIGNNVNFEVTITENLINDFANLSGDHSPIHIDNTYAQTTQFGQKIGHGMLAGIWFSQLVGMHLPGAYAVYLSQCLNFHKPFIIGKKAIVLGEIIQKIDAVQSIKIKTTVIDKTDGETLVSGEALVKLLS